MWLALGMADDRTFLIVGASMAGAQAAQQLRKDGFTGRVVLVGAETDRPYERPPLSKGYLLGKEPRDKAFIHDAQWYGESHNDLAHLAQAVYGLPEIYGDEIPTAQLIANPGCYTTCAQLPLVPARR